MIHSMLEEAAYTSVEDYNPGQVIAAVNELQPLGKEAALGRIASCIQKSGNSRYPYGLLWVQRVLFDLPGGMEFPSVILGTPNVLPPADPAALPRYPIVILRDIPLLVVAGYSLRGLPQPVEAHIEFFRAHGIIRPVPLNPSSSDGLESEFSSLWQSAYPGTDPSLALQSIRAQLTRMKP